MCTKYYSSVAFAFWVRIQHWDIATIIRPPVPCVQQIRPAVTHGVRTLYFFLPFSKADRSIRPVFSARTYQPERGRSTVYIYIYVSSNEKKGENAPDQSLVLIAQLRSSNCHDKNNQNTNDIMNRQVLLDCLRVRSIYPPHARKKS